MLTQERFQVGTCPVVHPYPCKDTVPRRRKDTVPRRGHSPYCAGRVPAQMSRQGRERKLPSFVLAGRGSNN